jgi:hypothetical protein
MAKEETITAPPQKKPLRKDAKKKKFSKATTLIRHLPHPQFPILPLAIPIPDLEPPQIQPLLIRIQRDSVDAEIMNSLPFVLVAAVDEDVDSAFGAEAVVLGFGVEVVFWY